MLCSESLLLGLAACAADPQPQGSLGVVAFSDVSRGEISLVDVETGARRSIDAPLGAPGAFAFSPDGRELAFAVEPHDFERHVFVANVETGAVREVSPETGEYMPWFSWGFGSWFSYSTTTPDHRTVVVTQDAQEGRLVGQSEIGRLVASPIEPIFAYSECVTPPAALGCERQVVVEAADGTMRRVLAPGTFAPHMFSLDGQKLIGHEVLEDGGHLKVLDVASGAATDLGPGSPSLAISASFDGEASLLSPDGTEYLTSVGEALDVVALDGSGRRTIAPRAQKAAFTTRGDLIYEVEEPLLSDGDGIRSRLYVHRVDRDLEIHMGIHCQTHVSASGSRLAHDCGDGVSVISLVDDTVQPPSDWDGVLGFTPGDEGLVVTTRSTAPIVYSLAHVGSDGTTTPLGEAALADEEGRIVPVPLYAYHAP